MTVKKVNLGQVRLGNQDIINIVKPEIPTEAQIKNFAKTQVPTDAQIKNIVNPLIPKAERGEVDVVKLCYELKGGTGYVAGSTFVTLNQNEKIMHLKKKITTQMDLENAFIFTQVVCPLLSPSGDLSFPNGLGVTTKTYIDYNYTTSGTHDFWLDIDLILPLDAMTMGSLSVGWVALDMPWTWTVS